jgi:DNA-binding transcriptional regulator YhcF (GntR family)
LNQSELDRPVPLYMQVVRQLRAQIATGELRDGDRVPSQREMMQRWRVSMQTASKVIGALKTEGLALPSAGRGTVVAPGAAARVTRRPVDWRQIAARMAAELAPMSNCAVHSLAQEDTANCPDCSIRRVYLDYLALGGTDTRLETTLGPGVRSVPIHELPLNDKIKFPGQDGG